MLFHPAPDLDSLKGCNCEYCLGGCTSSARKYIFIDGCLGLLNDHGHRTTHFDGTAGENGEEETVYGTMDNLMLKPAGAEYFRWQRSMAH